MFINSSRLSCPARVPGKSLTGACGLDTREALEFLRLHRNLAKADLASGPLDEGHAVRVQRLVHRGSARLGAGEGNTAGGLVTFALFATLAEVLDDGGLHGELDQVKREEPDNVLNNNEIMPSISMEKHLPRPK